MMQSTEPLVQIPERMFLGSLDDSVTRYPWHGVSVDLGALNRTLIFHVLLGPKVCCRVGNLLYNDSFLPCLTEWETSPLIELAENGFFQIQARADGINDSIAERLEIGTNSALRFRQEHGWTLNGKLFRRLEEVEKRLAGSLGFKHYNPNFVAAFKSICKGIEPIEGTPFETVFRIWHKEFGERDRSRSNFEILAERHLLLFADRLRAMQVINSINHYAYGSALRDDFKGAAIETKEIRDLQPLTSTIFGQEERTMDLERFEGIYKSEAMKVVQENLLIPADLFRDRSLWTKLARLTNRANGTASAAFLDAKQNFMEATARVIAGNTDETARKDLERISKAYSRQINSSLGTRTSRQFRVQVEFVGRKAAGHSVGIAFEKVAESFVPGLSLASKIAIEVVVKVYGHVVENSAIRGLDQFLVPTRPGEVILPDDISGPFEGLVVRRMDVSSSMLVGASSTASQGF